MQQAKFLKSTIVVGAAVLMASMFAPQAVATPDKGKDCKACHTGSPPNKGNAKKADAKDAGSKDKESKK